RSRLILANRGDRFTVICRLEHRATGYEDVCASRHGLVGGARLDASVDLEVDRLAGRVDHLAESPDLFELRGDEALPTEAWVDAHHEHEIEVFQDVSQDILRRMWVE